MIRITPHIALDESEIEESFARASGPGGQNVNKVSTAVRLRFDVRRSPNLPDDVRERLIRLAGKRLTQDGVLVVNAQRHRTQERNRRDALERLIELVRAQGDRANGRLTRAAAGVQASPWYDQGLAPPARRHRLRSLLTASRARARMILNQV
jgi:ribosome-associated protein